MKILAAVHNNQQLIVASVGLEFDGHQVDTVYLGLHAIERGLSGSYDVILIDEELPFYDGFTLAAQLRHAGVSTPILIFTDIVHENFSEYSIDHIPSSFTIHEIDERLNAIVNR